MFDWLKGNKPPKTAMDVITDYVRVFDKHKGAVVDASLLPAPKDEINRIIRAMCAIAPPHQPPVQLLELLSRGYILLASFQEGVGPRPLSTDYPNSRNADINSKWCLITAKAHDELDALNAEWDRFLLGERP